MYTALTIALPGVALAIAVGWMIWTVRQALIARRGPNEHIESYLRHDKATGAVAMCVAITGVVATVMITGGLQLLAVWPGAILGVLVIITCERRWPRPSGPIRSAPLVGPRRFGTLIPWFGVVLSFLGVVAAAAVIGFCWMVGDTPDGRTIRGNSVAPDSGAPNTVVTVDGFPGWTAGLMTVIGGVALLMVVAAGWWMVARRATLRAVAPDVDVQFRRASIDRMVRIVGIAAWITASNFYESARAAYTALQLATRPTTPLPPIAASWLPATCWIAVIVLYLVARPRPQVLRTSSAQQATQPA